MHQLPHAEHSAQLSGGGSPEVDLLSNESFSWHNHSDEEEDYAEYVLTSCDFSWSLPAANPLFCCHVCCRIQTECSYICSILNSSAGFSPSFC